MLKSINKRKRGREDNKKQKIYPLTRCWGFAATWLDDSPGGGSVQRAQYLSIGHWLHHTALYKCKKPTHIADREYLVPTIPLNLTYLSRQMVSKDHKKEHTAFESRKSDSLQIHYRDKWAMWWYSYSRSASFIPIPSLLSCSLTQPHYILLTFLTRRKGRLLRLPCVPVLIFTCECVYVLFACVVVAVVRWLMYNTEY